MTCASRIVTALMLAGMLGVGPALANEAIPPDEVREQQQSRWEATAKLGRRYWRWQRTLTVSEEVGESLLSREEEMRRRIPTVSSPGCTVLAFLSGRIAVRFGKLQRARGVLAESATHPAISFESLCALREATRERSQSQVPTNVRIEAMPLTPLTRSLGALRMKYASYGARPPTPELLSCDRAKQRTIAECIEEAGLHDVAWRCYAEAAYAGFHTAWITHRVDPENWLCFEAAEYWLRAAHCARLAGRQEVAWDFLTKAAVFGSDALFDQAQQTAKEWEDEPEPAQPQPVDPAVQREALTRAIRLYAELNAHPRALLLIDENRDAFDDPDALRKEIEEQWLAVIKDVTREAATITLYGVDVYPDGDPLEVRIPWALSDEALSHVREQLAALHADTAEAVPPAPPAAAEE